MNGLFEVTDLTEMVHYDSFLFLIQSLFILWIGKKVYDIFTPYKIDKELTTNDNKAVAVSFAGYLTGLGIIIWGVVSSPSSVDNIMFGMEESERALLLTDVAQVFIWSFIGIILLNISRIINDKLILSKFNNTKELIEDKNVGTGAVDFGAFIASAIIIKSVVSGETVLCMGWEMVGAIVFFTAGQILFIIFAIVYQKVTSYDFHAEIERDNAAAGISFGLALVAVGMLIANPILKSDSLVRLGVWFVLGTVLLIISKKIVDKLIFPDHKVDDEISKDQNWGVALVDGLISITVVLLLNSAF